MDIQIQEADSEKGESKGYTETQYKQTVKNQRWREFWKQQKQSKKGVGWYIQSAEREKKKSTYQEH